MAAQLIAPGIAPGHPLAPSMAATTPAPAPALNIAHAYGQRGPGFSWRGIGGVVLAHVGALALLASLDVLPLPLPVPTLMVEVLAPAPQPQPVPDKQPKPKPVERQPVLRPTPVTAPPTLAAKADAPAEASVPLVKEMPPPAPPAPPAPLPVSQPRFDADYLSNPAPAYPPLSRRMGEEGKVVLRVYVEPNGRPSQIEIKTSSGSPRLDQSAQDAVSRWKFIPARRGDDAVAAWVLVPIAFNLKG